VEGNRLGRANPATQVASWQNDSWRLTCEPDRATSNHRERTAHATVGRLTVPTKLSTLLFESECAKSDNGSMLRWYERKAQLSEEG